MEPLFLEPPAAARPGPDVCLFYSAQVLETLLQLPAGWHLASFARRDDGVYVAEVVLPDGPTTLPPLPLVARYIRCDADGRHGLALDSIDIA